MRPQQVVGVMKPPALWELLDKLFQLSLLLLCEVALDTRRQVRGRNRSTLLHICFPIPSATLGPIVNLVEVSCFVLCCPSRKIAMADSKLVSPHFVLEGPPRGPSSTPTRGPSCLNCPHKPLRGKYDSKVLTRNPSLLFQGATSVNPASARNVAACPNTMLETWSVAVSKASKNASRVPSSRPQGISTSAELQAWLQVLFMEFNASQSAQRYLAEGI